MLEKSSRSVELPHPKKIKLMVSSEMKRGDISSEWMNLRNAGNEVFINEGMGHIVYKEVNDKACGNFHFPEMYILPDGFMQLYQYVAPDIGHEKSLEDACEDAMNDNMIGWYHSGGDRLTFLPDRLLVPKNPHYDKRDSKRLIN